MSHECPIPRGIFTVSAEPLKLDTYRPLAYYPLRGRVWTAADNVYRTIFVEGGQGVIAFDSFDTPGAARSYRETIRRVLPDKPVHTLVYSHNHLDHTGYSARVAPDADVIAHELCARVVSARRSDGQLLVTESFDGERQKYDLDGVSFELIYPGPTHGDGNVAAYFPDAKLLFMVDTVGPGTAYTFYPDRHLGQWRQAMRRLLTLEWDLFVPGHFWPLSRSDFEANLDFHEQIEQTAQLAIADGIDPEDYDLVEEYARAALGAKHGRQFRFTEYAGQNLLRAMQHFLMGGWGFEGNSRIPAEPFT